MPDGKKFTFTISQRGLIAASVVIVLLVVAFLIGRSTSQPTHVASTASSTSTTGHPSSTTTAPPVVTTSTLPATTTTQPPATPTPVFVAGSYSGRQPTQIALAPACCSVIDHIAWSSWGSSQASGEGTWEYDTCTNGCVNGPFVPYPAGLTLSGPLGGTFTVLTVSAAGPYTGGTNFSYPNSWPYGAS